jgi:riboflavin synthase
MFTGIVEELGTLVSVRNGNDFSVLAIHGPLVTSDAKPGDSICVNGVCLTVTSLSDEEFTADVMGQTLKLSNLGSLQVGDRVNLERAMKADARFGGHMVQGHVDAQSEIIARTPAENWEVVRFGLPHAVAKYVAKQGSITIDGVSLTVSDLAEDWFEVSLIPTTLTLTTLGQKVVGDRVNLETDVLARHVERILQVINK